MNEKLQVNALSEWVIGIYLHEFTNIERELQVNALSEWIIGIYLYEFTNNECGIHNFEFIVSERVQVNSDN